MIPKTIASVHRVNVTSITRFFLKQFCNSVFKCQELTSQMPSIAARSPEETWINVTITKVSAKSIRSGILKKLPKEGTITTIIDIICSATAESITIPCCLYFFWLFRKTALSNKLRTTNWMPKLIVDTAYIKVTSHLKAIWHIQCKRVALFFPNNSFF